MSILKAKTGLPFHIPHVSKPEAIGTNLLAGVKDSFRTQNLHAAGNTGIDGEMTKMKVDVSSGNFFNLIPEISGDQDACQKRSSSHAWP